MTDNWFQHIPSGNRNINTIIQPSAAAEAMQPSSVPILQKFMFEFGSDGNVHSIFFLGNLSHEDIQRMLESVRKSADNGNFHYRIVGQIYARSKPDDTAHGYFAVRTGRGGQKILNLDTKVGAPVFPTFGCIDIMGVLININSITTSRQAKETALR